MEKVDRKLRMYSKIKELEAAGFSKRRIAKRLGVSRNTVTKYASQSAEEFTTWLASTQHRTQKLDVHKDQILSWLREYPDLSAAQIHDWLEERGFTGISYSTLRKYVRDLREDFQIPKIKTVREYEAIPDPPMGEQAQIDFGEIWVPSSTGKKVKLYVVSFVLSHSRYKYMEWWDHPYTAKDVIEAHEHAFEFFGGKPKTIVYDQDRTIFVNENYGDIIFTSEFEAYKQFRRFRIHACRGSDPESKGRIENVIGFIKKNFAKNRLFTDIDSWNIQSFAWLRRRGNGKIHNATKKIPLEVFNEEQAFLTPVLHPMKASASLSEGKMNTRLVQKDNTIKYKSNRYSVPFGTYTRIPEVSIEQAEQKLIIKIPQSGEVLTTHTLYSGHGKLIQNTSHRRDKQKTIPKLLEKVKHLFSNESLAQHYLEQIHQKYPRYTRDQVQLIEKQFDLYPLEIMDSTLKECVEKKIITATGFQSIAQINHKKSQKQSEKVATTFTPPTMSAITREKLTKITPEIRDVKIYTEILGGHVNE